MPINNMIVLDLVWIVSPKAVDGYVVSFVVSKYVNTNISKYFVFVD